MEKKVEQIQEDRIEKKVDQKDEEEKEKKAKDEEEKEKVIERYEKNRNDLKAIAVQLEGRLHHLQTSAFQLANLFFVFQGIIFAASGINASTGLHCSLRWLPTTLSALALLLNFIAFSAILNKYNKTSQKLHETWSYVNEYQREIVNIKQNRAGNRENINRLPSPAPPNLWKHLLVWSCSIAFCSFSAVVMVGCWKIPCL